LLRNVNEERLATFACRPSDGEYPRVRRLADRFGEAAASCTSMTALRALLADASGELGFRWFALLHHASLRDLSDRYVRIDNYPEAWAAEFIGSGLYRDDPVHRASRRASRGFEWSALGRLTRLGRKETWILERSRRFGLGDGMTVPVNVPGEPGGSCSFAVGRGGELPRQRLQCAELVGVHAFAAARRLLGQPSLPARPRLSRRELQCLRLAAAGKTDAEIAIVLGISTETARQYGKRARAAYDVVTRTQLVVLGLRDDWISFDEALDPRGLDPSGD
jgi:LuxR family quorum-sensing system transcriptional regulator CciR